VALGAFIIFHALQFLGGWGGGGGGHVVVFFVVLGVFVFFAGGVGVLVG